MKKQIFFLVLAIFTGLMAFGQPAIHHTAPTPLTCTTAGPLVPVAGVPYDYSAIINPATGVAYWYVTTSTTFVTSGTRVATEEAIGGSVVAAATNYQVATTGAASPTTTNITWNATGLNAVDPTHPLFVVVDYTASSSDCANNMKVYQIIPQNGFTLDIYNLDQTKANPVLTPISTCFSKIASAKFVGGAIVTDYGQNMLYYEVVAANFSTSWTPDLAVTGLQAGQTAVVEWSYDTTFGTTFSTGTPVTTNVLNTSNGVSIFVRVTINNGTYEGIADTPISLTVNGTSNGKPDVVNTDCTQTSLTDDVAVQTLLARPTVTSVPATGAFVTP